MVEGSVVMINSKIIKALSLSETQLQTMNEAKEATKFDRKDFILLGLAVLSLFLGFFGNIFLVFIPVAIVLVVIVIVRMINANRKYQLVLKDIIVLKMFEKNFDHVQYQPTKGFTEEFIESTQLIVDGNKFYSNDHLTASYKGVGFMQADVHVQQVTSDGDSTTTTDIFKGRWLVLDFFKEFSGIHQVRKNHGFFKNRKPLFSRKLKRVEFEDAYFNEEFTCYTDNEQEAFYLMTPRLMQHLLDYQEQYNCEIIIGFLNNKLHVAINDNTNAFEFRRKEINQDTLNTIQAEIDVIKQIVDDLNLDNELYKTEA